MAEYGSFIYGLIAMVLILIINILISKLLDVDIYLLFFGDIITLLTMIWYKICTGTEAVDHD